MGNVHATLMQFNNSAQSYADALKIQPQFDAAKSRRHAVLCHHKLEQALEEQHRYVCYLQILGSIHTVLEPTSTNVKKPF